MMHELPLDADFLTRQDLSGERADPVGSLTGYHAGPPLSLHVLCRPAGAGITTPPATAPAGSIESSAGRVQTSLEYADMPYQVLGERPGALALMTAWSRWAMARSGSV
jgi:hypothetical protein